MLNFNAATLLRTFLRECSYHENAIMFNVLGNGGNISLNIFLVRQKVECSSIIGSSFCGKSELARQIALRLVFEGYNYSFHTDLLSMTQFFGQNPSEDKVAILEDPWGHLEKSTESIDIWKRIENFSANLPPHQKMIITSRKEIIQSIYPGRPGTFKQLANQPWHDLTLSDTDFLVNYWKNISNERHLSANVIQLIERHLQITTDEKKLQIGQLKHLAGCDLKDLDWKISIYTRQYCSAETICQ